MKKLTLEKATQILKGEDLEISWNGDNVYQGLQIIAKLIDSNKNIIILGCNYDVMYSVDIEKLIDTSITESEIIELRQLGWFIDNNSLQCFV